MIYGLDVRDVEQMIEAHDKGREIVPHGGKVSLIYMDNENIYACWLGCVYVGLSGIIPEFNEHGKLPVETENVIYDSFQIYFPSFTKGFIAQIYRHNDSAPVGKGDESVKKYLASIMP